MLFGTGVASAACSYVAPNGICADVKIQTLYIETNGNAYVGIDGNPSSLPCALNDGFLTLPGTAPKFNSVYATLLAAQALDRRVTIRMGEQSSCTVHYVIVKAP
jgi:hypothetical protein